MAVVNESTRVARADRRRATRRECPECGSRDAVRDDFCDVCFAELDEGPWPPVARELDEFQFAEG
jgi:hypothetical protein